MKHSELNSSEIFEENKKKISKLHLPLPVMPKYESPEFNWPDDPSNLNNTQLGQMMLQMAGFYGYTQRLLGILESELTLVDAELKLKVNAASVPIRKELGRLNNEVIEAAVISNNEEFTPLYKRKLELLSIRDQLQSRLLIYEKFYQALSREQSRRDTETRIQ